MEAIVSVVSELTAEVITILLGTLAAFVLGKVRERLNVLKKKDELDIIDTVTDRVVEFVEAELQGDKGIEKRNLAVRKAIEILEHKGIKVSEAEVLSGIENGVRKLKFKNVEYQQKTNDLYK